MNEMTRWEMVRLIAGHAQTTAEAAADIQWLATVDWAAEIQRVQAEKAAERAKWERVWEAERVEWENRKHRCYRCARWFRRVEMDNGDGMTKADQYRGLHCVPCANEVRASYWSDCCLCGNRFRGSGLCANCRTDRHVAEMRRVSSHLSRARKHNEPATLTLRQWIDAIEYFGGICAYCGERPFTDLEHIVPVGSGAGTTVENCVPSCGPCNSSKARGGRLYFQYQANGLPARVLDYIRGLSQEAA